jgi:hypothetical protein
VYPNLDKRVVAPAHPSGRPRWLDQAISELDEHHVVVWHRSLTARELAASAIQHELEANHEAQVVSLAGARVHDLRSLRGEVDRALPDLNGRHLLATFAGHGGLLARLREPPPSVAGHHTKFRYYLIRDADVMLRASAPTFSVALDSLAGIAAESEYASDDLLLIHRIILVGGPDLLACHRDPAGPLRAWREASAWSHVTRVAGPSYVPLEAR